MHGLISDLYPKNHMGADNKKVIVLEYLDGEKLEAMFHMILNDGIFHADPYIIIMVGLIVNSSLNRRQTILWDITAIEIGFIVAFFMFVWLLISIFRSGRF